MKGRFFVIEGMDGAGTTTQSRLLKDNLEKVGRKVHLTSEPTSNAIGKIIRTYLSGAREGKNLAATLALLFAADRLAHFDEEISPKLAEGFDVISDRYLTSSLVYQGLDLPNQWVSSINQFAPPADLVIVLDVHLDTASSRLQSRGGEREIFESAKLQESIRSRYLKLSQERGVALVDGNGGVEVVTARILDIVRDHLSRNEK